MYRHTRRPARRKLSAVLRTIPAVVPVVFLATLLTQAVFATTYVITDGEKTFTYTTFATNPDQVLSSAGVNLGDADSYTTQATEGTASITVRRAQKVEIRYHGENFTVSSAGETVGQLLSRLELDVTASDVLSVPLEADVPMGTTIQVDRVTTRLEIYTVSIPYETETCASGALPQGMEEELIAGSDGEARRTALVTYVNGQETGREVQSETVVRPAVNRLVSVGTAKAAEGSDKPVIGDGIITLPTGEVLHYSRVGQVRATAYTHTDAGCDLITSTGSTVHIGTVAVDPRYIPYGTRMFIVSNDGSYVYGISEAEDCGGDIKGDRVDLYFPTFAECMQFGRRTCTVYYLT